MGNRISDRGCMALARYLGRRSPNNEALKELHLSDNEITESGLGHLLVALVEASSSIENFNHYDPSFDPLGTNNLQLPLYPRALWTESKKSGREVELRSLYLRMDNNHMKNPYEFLAHLEETALRRTATDILTRVVG